MGNLGFLFTFKNQQIVIFTLSNKFEGNIILGFENIKIKKCKFYFLSKELSLENFLILDDFNFKHSKIKVFNQRIVDFEDFVFFVKPKEYKELMNLLILEFLDDEILIKNTIDLYSYFN